jgi:phosphate uptake regulator
MFSNLSSFWRGSTFMTTVLKQFKQMLEQTQEMYVLVRASLVESGQATDPEARVWEIDKEVNATEKEIRKRIVQHLSLQPTVDVNACLLLMSVVKDAERLGDYAKNLYEVTRLLAEPIAPDLFARYFDTIDRDILTLFSLTRDAFLESVEDKAEMAWGYERKITKWCDNVVQDLAESTLSANQAVCLALIARYFKRIAAHLANIATSVVLPLSDLDYFDEKRKMG